MASSQGNSDVCMCNEEDYASDTFALIYHLDNRASAIRIVDSYFWVAVGVTNNSTNYYTYRVDISANGGTITNLLNETSTGFGGINTNWVATIPDTTIAQNSNGARSSVILKKVGNPTNLTFRGVLRYRLVG